MKKITRKVLLNIVASIIAIGVLISVPFIITSCNEQIIDLKLKFRRVHIFDTGECYEISSWTDYDSDQIQVTLKTGETIVLSAGLRFALVETNDCPFEHKGK